MRGITFPRGTGCCHDFEVDGWLVGSLFQMKEEGGWGGGGEGGATGCNLQSFARLTQFIYYIQCHILS
jgi:hypothetical protein